jgi:hypothetical protein
MNDTIKWRNLPARVAPKADPSFDQLCCAMKNRTQITVIGAWGHPITGLVNRIEAEDGSGKCWNVTLQSGIHTSTIFVRTA